MIVGNFAEVCIEVVAHEGVLEVVEAGLGGDEEQLVWDERLGESRV